MSLTQFIMTYWLELLLTTVTTASCACIKGLYVRNRALKLGVQAMLRDRIVTSYYHYRERKSITLHGLENVNRMYEQYHNLGGNGSVTTLVEYLRTLEVVDD